MLSVVSSDDMTRTTLNLDPAVLASLKARQRAEGKSLGALASELLAQALEADRADPAPLQWASHPMGTPRVDLEDKDALWAVLDER
jgi:plasmid stability protein